MKMRIANDMLEIIDTNSVEYNIIRSWGLMKWDRSLKMLRGTVTLELLDKLAGMVRLPPTVEARRVRLRAVQDAVDHERFNQEPVPYFQPPVKAGLYRHQIRAFDMALLVFGWAVPTADASSGRGAADD